MNGFCNVNSLKTLNRGATSFKNCNNPSHAIQIGISDLHKIVHTVIKTYYKKQKPFNIEITNIFMDNLLILSWVDENWC